MSKPRVAVIGAGICGLSALKEALADGFDAVCFDARAVIGGAWAYQPDNATGPVHSSVYAGTVLNSCRDTSSFSDFPLDPARYTDYFSHRLFVGYLREYAEHFDLVRHIQLHTRVLKCDPQDDGTWKVTVQREGGDGNGATPPETLAFGAVIVAAGHLTVPRMPSVPGRERFEGEVMHSALYRTSGPFEGKRVAVVGFGSSAVDIACEIAPQAKELHLISRRGGWVIPRFVLGLPVEAYDNRATQLWVPLNLGQWLQTKLLNFVQGSPPKELAPDHRILEQNTTIRGDFMDKVHTGIIKLLRGEISQMSETSITVALSKDSERARKTGAQLETLDVDVVIFATGYEMFNTPYLPADVLRTGSGAEAIAKGDSYGAQLYRLIHPIHYQNIFFHGFVELLGPLPASAEAQARYTASVLAGRIRLPPPEEMAKKLAAFRKFQSKHFVHSERHMTTGHQIPYIDELLEEIGAAPTFTRLLRKVFTSNPFRALSVISAVWFSVPCSAQWRLVGYGAKRDLATETVLRTAASKPKLSKRELDLLAKDR